MSSYQRNQSPFLQGDAAPLPVLLLLAHTDLAVDPGAGLLMHEDLPARAISPPTKVRFVGVAPAPTYPPETRTKLPAPSGLSRLLLANYKEWKEGPEAAHLINVRPADPFLPCGTHFDI